MKIVKNLKLLKEMEKSGFIKLAPDTGKKVWWNNIGSIAWYINDGKYTFKFKNKWYGTRYSPGTFYPYVVILDEI